MSDEQYKKILSKKLNYYLSIKQKSQKEVADYLNISTTTFNNWCMGTSLPRMGKIQMLADYFGIEKSDLLEDKSDQPEQDHYYLDDDAREAAEFLHKNPDYKVLFDASRKVKKEDIDFVKKMLDKFGE